MQLVFLEEGLPYGNTVDYYFQSVYNKELYLQLQSNAMKSKYNIRRYCSPFQLGGDKRGLFLFPSADHWAVLSLDSTIARFMMGRPLPTQGMQMLAFAAIMGFKKIYMTGVDMYQDQSQRYSYSISDKLKSSVRDKDLNPG